MLENKISLLEPVVKKLYTKDHKYKYRLFKRHRMEFYLAFLQFSIESSYRWDPQCFRMIDSSQGSECYESKFKKIPMELKCTNLDETEYWRRCAVKTQCVQCHYSKDINTGEENLTVSGDGIRSEDCLNFSGDNDETFISDCPNVDKQKGFCYNELALELKSGLLEKMNS